MHKRIRTLMVLLVMCAMCLVLPAQVQAEEDGHVHEYAKAYSIQSCTSPGGIYYFCYCGYSYFEQESPALGHDWVEVETIFNCVTTYTYKEVCTRCEQTSIKEFPMYGPHSYEKTLISGTCQERSHWLYVCEWCGDSYQEESNQWGEHVFGEGQVTVEPTYTTEGEMRWYCQLCSSWRWEMLPALGVPFADVDESQYYFDPVIWALTNSITSGTDATHFSPNQNCTRGQVVTFLWRAAGCPEPAGAESPFWDVSGSHYFYKAVLWAVEKGITQGVGGGRFAPDQEVTRAQFVTFLWRWAGLAVFPDAREQFADVNPGDYYSNAVIWALNYDITKGISATEFGSGKGCTRAQVVTFLYRYDRNPLASGNWFSPPVGVQIGRHELWQPAKDGDLSALPGFREEPTAENLMAVLEVCSPDSALFLRWDQDDFLSWIESTRLTADTNTAVHETYHAFSEPGNGKSQRYYLGEGYYVDLDTTPVYYSSEISQWLPEEHHTFRYDLYIIGSEHANMWSIKGGIYGLLNEFNAYGTGMMYDVSMFDYYCAQGCEYDSVFDYINGAENDRMAYAEFRYWILTYLLYAQENYPAIYEGLLENTALRYAFKVVEGRYAQNIALYEKQLERIANDEIPGLEGVRVENGGVYIGAYGMGRFTKDYTMLMEYMERPEYQEMMKTFCDV